MSQLQTLLDACLYVPDFHWKWIQLMKTLVDPLPSRMEEIPQNPAWHGKGNVGMCEALATDPAFRMLPPRSQQALSVVALLHYIGKIANTKFEKGKWISQNHSSMGVRMDRELLSKEFDLCGTQERQAFPTSFVITCFRDAFWIRQIQKSDYYAWRQTTRCAEISP